MRILSIDVDWVQSGLHVDQLNKVFFTKVNEVSEIVFGDHHHLITENIKSDNVILHNIDHHHDIVYKDDQVENIKNNIIKSPHWIGNLIHQKKIKEYHWYKNINSQFIRDGYFGEKLLLENDVEFKYYENLDNLINQKFDLLFVCKSPFYTPGEFQILHNTYLEYCRISHSDKVKEIERRINVHNY